MPSFRSRLVRFLMKHRHLLRLQLKPITVDWQTSIADLRQLVEESAGKFGKLPARIEVSPASQDGLAAEWIMPAAAGKDKAILYFHGGGYVVGSCPAHRAIVAKFVKESGVGALLFGYRQAPEHPFPAALEDALTAYQWLLSQGLSPANIIFVGDSAGGGLCLATLIALKDKGIPLPAAAVALSPWTDLTCSGESYQTKVKVDPATWPGSWIVFSHYYAKDNDPTLPWISPFYGDLHGLPPMLIYVGSEEVMLDDSTRFAQKAQEAGVDVTLRVGEGMFHCYPVCAPLFPEAKQAMDEICTFIKTYIGASHQEVYHGPEDQR